MAHRPTRKSAAGTPGKTGAGAAAAAPMSPAGSERERIVAAFLTLLADGAFEEIGLGDVAAAAGVSLAQLRDEFSSTFAILSAHIKAMDRAVLGEDLSDMAEEPARERLFDVLMRRLEHLAPHRAAIGSLVRSARRNPPLALALNAMARRSQQWMLAAAGIDAAGPRGMVRAQATAVMFASVLPVWIDDDDPGHARTMAALDRALGRGQRLAGFLDELVAIPSALCRFGRRRRRRSDDDVEEAVA